MGVLWPQLSKVAASLFPQCPCRGRLFVYCCGRCSSQGRAYTVSWLVGVQIKVIATSDLWLFIHASNLLPSTPHPTPLQKLALRWLPKLGPLCVPPLLRDWGPPSGQIPPMPGWKTTHKHSNTIKMKNKRTNVNMQAQEVSRVEGGPGQLLDYLGWPVVPAKVTPARDQQSLCHWLMLSPPYSAPSGTLQHCSCSPS